MLMKFESFVPKNLEKRQEELKRIKEREKIELKELALQLQKAVDKLKDVKNVDKKEKFFIEIFKNVKIQIDNNFTGEIIFIDNNQFSSKGILASYNVKDKIVYVSYYYIWEKIEMLFQLEHSIIEKILKNYLNKYFDIEVEYVEAET